MYVEPGCRGRSSSGESDSMLRCTLMDVWNFRWTKQDISEWLAVLEQVTGAKSLQTCLSKCIDHWCYHVLCKWGRKLSPKPPYPSPNSVDSHATDLRIDMCITHSEHSPSEKCLLQRLVHLIQITEPKSPVIISSLEHLSTKLEFMSQLDVEMQRLLRGKAG